MPGLSNRVEQYEAGGAGSVQRVRFARLARACLARSDCHGPDLHGGGKDLTRLADTVSLADDRARISFTFVSNSVKISRPTTVCSNIFVLSAPAS